MSKLTLLDLVSMAMPVMVVAHEELRELDPEAAARIDIWVTEARAAIARAEGLTVEAGQL